MSRIHADFTTPVRPIHAVHATGQPPLLGATTTHFHYLGDAHIPYSRLHDVGGMFGGSVYVDIPNIFRDFDADETDPASYDFAFTDRMMAALVETGCEPYFRLGITIENYPYVKMYRLDPPKDYAKWARICEHIVRHYTEGWANGFTYTITYWEIWNEPDSMCGSEDAPFTMMWNGTKEDYFRLYDVTTKHLRACFGDRIKLGGFASCGFYGVVRDPERFGLKGKKFAEPTKAHLYFIEFFEDFLDYVQANGCPMDFCSWHSYGTVWETSIMAEYVKLQLSRRGFSGVESHLNEWNNAHEPHLRGSSFAAAEAAAMLVMMQKKDIDVACYYDSRIGPSTYGGMFNPITYKPFALYYGFQAFGELYLMGTEMLSESDSDKISVVCAAAEGKCGALVVNTGAAATVESDLPADMKAYLIDADHHRTEADIDPTHFSIGEHQCIYFVKE